LNSVLLKLSRAKAHRIHFGGITESYREGKQKTEKRCIKMLCRSMP